MIALSGGRSGEVGVALVSGRRADAVVALEEFVALFGDRFYLETSAHGACRRGRLSARGSGDLLRSSTVRLSRPMMCAFCTANEFEAHEARVCIHEGRALDDPRRERRYSEQQYLRSPDEMCELFADIPEALENSVEIAKRCTLEIRLGEYFLPDYPIP